ncbi:MAG: hypothetical protein GXP48_04475 [Acidobacteria bacterium]|nr:hypothetical protein [Acidobacteriota bacterium]
MSRIRRCLTRLFLLLGAALGGYFLLRQDGPSHGRSELPLAGNPGTHVFHRRGCRVYHPHPGDPEFIGREAALDAGFRPCGICKP